MLRKQAILALTLIEISIGEGMYLFAPKKGNYH